MNQLLYDLVCLPKGIVKFFKCVYHIRRGTLDMHPSLIRWWDWFTDSLKAWGAAFAICGTLMFLVIQSGVGSEQWSPEFEAREREYDIENGVYVVTAPSSPSPIPPAPVPAPTTDDTVQDGIDSGKPLLDLEILDTNAFKLN